MGYTTSKQWATKKQMVDHITNDFDLLDSSLRGNVLYGLVDCKGTKVIYVFLIQSFGVGEYGYKEMSEDMQPYYYDCPLRILNKSTVDSPYAVEWRTMCRNQKRG